MTDKELLQEALESIEWLRLHLERDHKCLHMKSAVSGIPDWLNKTEASLRARLAQPEKEWVGLTDAEAMEIEDTSPDIRWAIIQAEAKLKEKNT